MFGELHQSPLVLLVALLLDSNDPVLFFSWAFHCSLQNRISFLQEKKTTTVYIENFLCKFFSNLRSILIIPYQLAFSAESKHPYLCVDEYTGDA